MKNIILLTIACFLMITEVRANDYVIYDIWGQDASGKPVNGINPYEYRFANASTSSSFIEFPNAGLMDYAIAVYFTLSWRCNNTNNSLELIIADSGPSNIQRIALFQCDGYTHPQKSFVDLTDTWNDMISTGGFRVIGFRFKGLQYTQPEIYTMRFQIYEDD